MNETVISRPSLYDMLGVDPAASVAEIEQAFARRISLFTPSAFGNVAHFGIAYQTLRDPVKRDRYDRSIGLEPRGRQGLPSLRPGQAMFIAAQHRDPTQRRPDDHAITMHPIAAEPRPEPPPRAEPAPIEAETDLILRDILARRAEPEESRDAPIHWKRTGLAVGGVIAAVAMLGAWAGWQASNDAEPEKLEAAVNLALPPAKTLQPSVIDVPADIYAAPPARDTRRMTAVRRSRTPDPLAPVADAPPPEAAPAGPVISGTADAPVPPFTDASAQMPLSNRTVASTIERIGYACGSVESTSALGGGFKVNCSSGQSYQATKVRGRYRFRRL